MAKGPVLPIDFIGPDFATKGSFPVAEWAIGKFTAIPGDSSKPDAMLPPEVEFSEVQKQRFITYLVTELDLAESERFKIIEQMAKLYKKYRIKTPTEPKNWPIANASQITIPVIKTAVNTISSRIYQTVMAADPLVRVRTDDEDYNDVTFDYEEFLKLYSEGKLEVDDVLEDVITESVIFGTSVMETSNYNNRMNHVTYDQMTGKYRKTVGATYSGPRMTQVPIDDFWIRPAWQDIQTAPWCGKEIRLTWSQVKDRAANGDFNPEAIKAIESRYMTTDVNRTLREKEDIERNQPFNRYLYRIYRLAVRWDVDGDGIEEDLMVYFHRESRTLLRCTFNGYPKSVRPWTVFRYIKIPGRFYGEGLAETLEALQDEISTIHNQRIDNATIANLRIVLVSKLINGLKPGDRLWSGKIVKVTNVKEDVGTLQLGDIYPSTIANESQARQYVTEVSGAGDVLTGQATPVSRTTAAAQLALLEELNRRFDKTLKGYRKSIRNAYRQLCYLFYQQGTGGLAETWLGAARGQRLEATLKQPLDLLDNKLKIFVEATQSSNNREIDFQTQIAVMQLIIQLGNQMLGMTTQLAPQITGVVAHELVHALRPVFRKVMQYAGAGDPDQAVSVLTVLDKLLPAPEDMGGMASAQAQAQSGVGGIAPAGTAAGANGSAPPGPEGVAGLAGLSSLAAAFNGTGRR